MPPRKDSIVGPVIALYNALTVTKRFLYKPYILLPDLSELINKTIEVRVHRVYLTKFNKAVMYR